MEAASRSFDGSYDSSTERMGPFCRVEEALAELRRGRMIIVIDSENRENEGDLVMAAQAVTPEAVNFMAQHGRGLICVPLTPERADELDLPLMVEDSTDPMGTAFTVTVDAADTRTGISAHERARTIQALVAAATRPHDLRRPGHIFPLRAREGGVLERPGHTEAAVDLARLAGLKPAGVICEIMKEDGRMARLPDLISFARRHQLKLLTIEELIRYRQWNERERISESRSPERVGKKAIEPRLKRVASAGLPTDWGDFEIVAYQEEGATETHVALVRGEVSGPGPILVRVHSECLTGDVFHSLRCDCGEQLALAMEEIAQAGRGVLVYLRQEGRGIGLANKVKAYALQDAGLDTVEANEALGLPVDAREYEVAARILADLGVERLRLLTNNPRKYNALTGYGLEVVERMPLRVKANPANERYLNTKRLRLGHLL